jgi:hypothetical protein
MRRFLLGSVIAISIVVMFDLKPLYAVLVTIASLRLFGRE